MKKAMQQKFRLLLLSLFVSVSAYADFDEDYALKTWQEIEVQLPSAPRPESLQSFYVGAATDNRFLIDLSSLSVGSDGVVRYVLLVLTPGGARNVTFEGMRCETGERRIYASGRSDGAWSKSRNNDWMPIKKEGSNRYHAALYFDYFCPDGIIVQSVKDAKDALRRGGPRSTGQGWW